MLKPDAFAILPWGGTPGNRDALNQIRECGFNLAGFVKPEHLDRVHEAGLACIVSDKSTHVGDAEAKLGAREIARRVKALVSPIKGHPAVFGYYLRDEPGAKSYPGLAKWAAAFQKADPEALAYINLFPNYASPAQMNAPDYAHYLESFIRTVKPRFLSYDHYALMDDGSLRDGYYSNLEAMSGAARRHDLPFWNIVLGNAHFRYAEPTEAGLRFQLYTTLAYGARGISYFTYFAPPIGNYRLAPIDQFGHKTPTWDMLRNVNLQAHQLGPVYVTLRSVNVFHHPEVPAGCCGLDSSRFIAEVKGGSLLVGEFEGHNRKPFALVVNKSLHHSASFSLRFKKPGSIDKISSYTGRIEPLAGENNWLAAGQGMLLCLNS